MTAIEKKVKIAENLAIEIANQMKLCSCGQEGSTCGLGSDASLNPSDKCELTLEENECPGTASKEACESIKKPCKYSSPDCELCPPEAKNLIEFGLKQFRTNFHNDYESIKQFVEYRPEARLGGEKIWVIAGGADTCGDCSTCDFNCPECDLEDEDYEDCLEEQEDCLEEQEECSKEQQECLAQNSFWYNIPLVDKLTYLKGKLEKLKEQTEKDLKNLKQGAEDLNKCYAAESYVDFLKTYEKTNKEETTILIATDFKDPSSESDSELLNPSKYCEGYQYESSACYSRCQKQCPGTTEMEFNCYKTAPDCSNLPLEAKKICLEEQAKIVKACFDKRTCISVLSPYTTFSECMASCKIQCLNSCEQDVCVQKDKEICKKKCELDSMCLLKNEGSCLVNFNKLKDCTKYSDLSLMQNCAETSAFLCQYCTNQYAGYAECLKHPYYLSGYSSSDIYKNHQYYLYGNGVEDYQVCSDPDKMLIAGGTRTICQSLHPETAKCPSSSICPDCPCGVSYTYFLNKPDGSSGDDGIICSNDECPDPDGSGICSIGYCDQEEEEEEDELERNDSETSEEPLSLAYAMPVYYQACSGICEKYSFNDDPLTFYCQKAWWKKIETEDQEPMGNNFVCEKEQEIPIGNAIDETKAWTTGFIAQMQIFVDETQELIKYLNIIGAEENYCKCSSECEPGERLCMSKCVYGGNTCPEGQCPGEEEGSCVPCPIIVCPEGECLGEDGICSPGNCPTPEESFYQQKARTYFSLSEDDDEKKCSLYPVCLGNPCQKMIKLLTGENIGGSCSTVGNGVAWYASRIPAYSEQSNPLIGDRNIRSEILKKLEYSRKMINTCSQNYEKQTKILSCTRIIDEIIPPIIGSAESTKKMLSGSSWSSYCYGNPYVNSGIDPSSIPDNWYCCQAK